MAHAEASIVIARPPLEVYAFLADGTNNMRWRSGVTSIELRSGRAGELDAVYAQTLTGPGGRRIAGDYRITSAVPGTELRFAVIAGPARPEGAYLLTPDGDGTRVTFSLSLTPTGLMKLMGRTIQKTMDAEVAQLPKLKAALES
ncbi:SRPBCC family protein [Microbacterium sp. X-17]|uniref:SRPBCC family protein n=1 Tax=Microbacterium sp. X-17 TaxID=3144404 RepID=UPI0031F4BA16